MFAGVGERTREGTDLWLEMQESGVIDKAALVYGQMDEPPGVRLRVGLAALTMAEYFRDVQNQDVLLFIDNIFRFVQAGSEVSTLLGRMPSAVGYQPTLADEMGELQERITSTKGKSITSLQAVYVPADDYTDPAPFTTFTHLDATTELSRQIAALGIYPAVDPLASTSNILAPEIVGDRHYAVARRVQEILQRYKELQDIIAILGLDELSEEDRVTVSRAAQDPALLVPALLRGRGLHRRPGHLRPHRRDGRVVRGPGQRRARRRPRAGVPERRRSGVGAGEGPEARGGRRLMADDVFGWRWSRRSSRSMPGGARRSSWRTSEGDLTVLDGHTPLVGDVVPGMVRVEPEDGDDRLPGRARRLLAGRHESRCRGRAGRGRRPAARALHAGHRARRRGRVVLGDRRSSRRSRAARRRPQRVADLQAGRGPAGEETDQALALAEAEGALARAELRVAVAAGAS